MTTNLIIVFLLLSCTSKVEMKHNFYQAACYDLRHVAFQEDFDFDKIDKALAIVLNHLDTLAEEIFHSSNCADSLWMDLKADRRIFGSWTYGIERDSGLTISALPNKLDSANLNQEFRFNPQIDLQD